MHSVYLVDGVLRCLALRALFQATDLRSERCVATLFKWPATFPCLEGIPRQHEHSGDHDSACMRREHDLAYTCTLLYATLGCSSGSLAQSVMLALGSSQQELRWQPSSTSKQNPSVVPGYRQVLLCNTRSASCTDRQLR